MGSAGREPWEVVRASLAQLAEAQLLLQEYFDEIGVILRDTPAQLRDCLSDASCGFWIASVENTPAGCVVLRPLPSVPLSGECKRLYVRPKFRGRGISGHLLDAMESHALWLGLRWVYLDSKDDLHEALRIYRKRGYVPCERYNHNPQATVFLRRELEHGTSAAAL